MLINNNQIQADLLYLIDNLDIVEEQITPRRFINLNYLDSIFYSIQIMNDEPKNISISISPQNKNKCTFLQIIPDGL